MLNSIHISNFAIVDHLELDLPIGMIVLTGETGAGKSILLDALGLALGDRADSQVVRHGCDRAEINITFDIATMPEVQDWLQQRELDDGTDCLIRRTINADGRSRGYINGQPQPLTELRELGEMLVDIHGQHAHQSLLKRDSQRQTLDAYAAHPVLVAQTQSTYKHWQQLRDELDRMQQQRADRDARLDLLRFQVDELDQLAPQPNEMEHLELEHQRLAHASKLLEGSERAYQMLYDNEQGAVLSLLQNTSNELSQLSRFDEALAPIAQLLEGAAIQVQEAASELRHYTGSVELDPAQLAQVESRMGELLRLARKHHTTANELPAHLDKLRSELDALENADLRAEHLNAEIKRAAQTYRSCAEQLSASRRAAATKLSEAVSQDMQQLGMKGARFEIQLIALAEGEFSTHGLERIEYMVCTNPGQPAQPLSKIASGGELSRISLAIAVNTASQHGIPTLVFDEVDVGIGGGTAEIVGHLLRQLGSTRQVLCVTHQPQVAALGHHHLHVSKQAKEGATVTQIQPLLQQQRVEELARMLGGIEITQSTLLHAGEMLERSQRG